ncbi:dimethylarginine dimethylaminohydrolase family protein [Halobacillus kuroshimensis]|uniref:dimethylarginine dimethylaminohydrolase family protein n=1 Tax=Halobacillus kuroshimensis TaxID=302481 RepID=UPI0030F4C523
MKDTAARTAFNCSTEYGQLLDVLVSEPRHMRIEAKINETQKHYEGIQTNVALQQHRDFVHLLKEEGITVHQLPSKSSLHEQVFTRDIGFVIDSHFYTSSMKEDVRKGETSELTAWMNSRDTNDIRTFHHPIEGGDVLVDANTIWIGHSGRTSMEAVQELKQQEPDRDVNVLSLADGTLHLDCVLNILDAHTALAYPEAFTDEGWQLIQERFEVIPATKDETFHMGPNVLSIGRNKVISLSRHTRLNESLEKKGFEVLPVDFSEIIKSGGAFRCCTLPLYREDPRDTAAQL